MKERESVPIFSASPEDKMFNIVAVFPASSPCTVRILRASHHRSNTWARGFNLCSQSTDADVRTFMKTNLFLGATDAQINSIADKYSQDPAEVRRLL